MDDYNDALQTLRPDDLAFLSPGLLPAKQTMMSPAKRGKPRRSSSPKASTPPLTTDAPPDAAVELIPPESEPTAISVAVELATTPKAVKSVTGTPAAAPDATRQQPVEAAAVDTASAEATDLERKRKHVERDWPPSGTILVADYCGVRYHAEVVPAKKRLKSGKQIRLLDGPAKGKRLDSFSKAMQVATAKQRRTQKLGNHGMANGWSFWLAQAADGKITPRTSAPK